MIKIITSSTAQGGGGSFKDTKQEERWVFVMHGWQSESTDGSKDGWGSESLPLSHSLRHLLSVPLYLSLSLSVYLSLVWCSEVVVVTVVVVV